MLYDKNLGPGLNINLMWVHRIRWVVNEVK